MEENGWIVSSLRDSAEGRRRRYYRLTAQGRRRLEVQREQWDLMTEVLNLAWGGANV
jgi:DNA-binding PadR family transcriptional regulator